METTKPTKAISQSFEEFLADQKGRISPKTFSKYPKHHRPLRIVPRKLLARS